MVMDREVFDINITDEGTAVCHGPEEFDCLYTSPWCEVVGGLSQREDVRSIIVNLGRTSFLDASGIRAILQSRQDTLAAGKQFEVLNVQRSPLKVLKLVGVADYLSIPQV